MNARSIGDVLRTDRGKISRHLPRERRGGNGTPVWRNSYNEGQLEDRLWKPIAGGNKRRAKRLLGATLKAARELEEKSRRTVQEQRRGSRNGVLGPVAIRVLEYLHKIVDFSTGELAPAVQTIADAISRSYGAVHNALKALRSHGFLHWIRRCRPTESKGEAGPQAVQIPNAYILLVPDRLRALVRAMVREAPTPTDASWSREQQKADLDAMILQLSAAEFLQAEWSGDDTAGPIFKILEKMARGFDQARESSRMRETGGL